jgi:acyl dehydratase
MNAPATLYLEDLYPGQQFLSGTHQIDAAEIKAFAAQFDPQPFHLDETAAAVSAFGGLVASGWHTAALTMRLLTLGLRLSGGLIGAGGEIQWPHPTRPGAILQVRSEVLTVRPSRSRPERGVITVRSETRNQYDETLQRMISTMIALRRPQD